MEYGFSPRWFASPLTRFFLILLLGANVAVWYAYGRSNDWLPPQLNAALRVEFFAVGQGDAILVLTPRGRKYLIDGGDAGSREQAEQAGHKVILDHLARLHISHLDGIVVSHFHNDHLGGVIKVIHELKVDRVWDPGGTTTTSQFQGYEELLKRKRIPRLRVQAGDRLDWGEELDVQILHPEPVQPGAEPSDQNARSVVLLVRYGSGTVLLPGDIERNEQRELARYGAGLHAQVLKVPHHGSTEGLFFPFLDLVAPRDAVISVGKENPFGYPASTTLQAYQQRSIRLRRTDQDGSVMAYIGGDEATDSKVEVDRSR